MFEQTTDGIAVEHRVIDLVKESVRVDGIEAFEKSTVRVTVRKNDCDICCMRGNRDNVVDLPGRMPC